MPGNPEPSPETRFKPGQSGNPGGMLKGTKHSLTSKLRAILDVETSEGRDRADALVSVLLRIALEGDRQAIKDIFERVDGKVPESEPVSASMRDVQSRRAARKAAYGNRNAE